MFRIGQRPRNSDKNGGRKCECREERPDFWAYSNAYSRRVQLLLVRFQCHEKSPKGQVVTHIHKYTELTTGMHYQDANGNWVEAKELIESYATGAIARQGLYQVIFANNLNTRGAIDLQTPEGKRLRSNVLGLSYYDTATGNNVLIAQIKDTQGELISPNQVLYPDAFAGVKADVRYTYKRGSFEQDVILREQPPTPESLGLNSATVEIQVMTEFLNPPEDRKSTRLNSSH